MARQLKLKVPKRVAGLKIPKSVRKGPVMHFLNSSAGQILLAETLIVLGGMFVARRADPDSTTGQLLRHPVEGMRDLGRVANERTAKASDTLTEESARISHAMHAALRAFRSAMDQDHATGSSGAQSESTLDGGPGELQNPSEAKKKQTGTRSDSPSTPH